MQDFEALKDKWNEADWRERASLAIEIGKAGTAEAEKFLRDALDCQDETYFVRGFAALALSGARMAQSIDLLAAKLNRFVIFQCDSSEFVRAKCAHALRENANFIRTLDKATRDGALHALRSALEDESSFVVEEAIPALGVLKDRESVLEMYMASESLVMLGGNMDADVLATVMVQGKRIELKKNVDYQPLALAMADIGITEPHAVVVYGIVLATCPVREKAEAALVKIGKLFGHNPAMDRDGKLSSAIRGCKARMAFDDSARDCSESFVDSVIGRISRPTYVGERKMVPPPLPNKR